MNIEAQGAAPITPLQEPCNCFALRRAARALSREYDRWLRPLDLSNTQFSMLYVARIGMAASITEMADALGMERTSLTRNLRPLQKRGLLTVSAEGPRRVRSIGLTAAGEAMIEQALPLWRQAQNEVAQRMGAAEAGQMRELVGLAADSFTPGRQVRK